MFFAFFIDTFVSDTYTSSRFLYGEERMEFACGVALGRVIPLSYQIMYMGFRREGVLCGPLYSRESSVSEKMDGVKSRV